MMARGKKKIDTRGGLNVRKGDTVVVIAGAEKGKRGRVLRSYPKAGRVVVEGVNFMKRHQRPTQTQRQGGIIEMEAGMTASNLMVVCGKCGEPTRVAHKEMEGGGRARACIHCEEILD